MRGHPFQSPDARRLALLFAIVYFAQGMVYLPEQVVAIVFKERGLTAGQLAAFTWITTIPWFIKPVYGLLSDFVPLFGSRRRSYFLIMSGGGAGRGVGWGPPRASRGRPGPTRACRGRSRSSA
jgi:hypothetical protein